MTELERKKKVLEMERVKLAQKELEFKIEEKMDEIQRLKDHILIQTERIKQIEEELK